MLYTSFCPVDIETESGQFGMSWLYNIGLFLNKEEGINYAKQFDGLSETDFYNLKQIYESSFDEADTLTHFTNICEYQASKDYNMNNSYVNFIPAISTLCDRHVDRSLQTILSRQGATDRVFVSMNAFQKLFAQWHRYSEDLFLHNVPSDLLISQKIQISDMEICLTDIDPKYNGKEVIIRVHSLFSECVVVNKSEDEDDETDHVVIECDDDGKVYRRQSFSKSKPIPAGLIDVPLSEDGHSGFIATFAILPGLNEMLLYGVPCAYGMSGGEWSSMVKDHSFAEFIQTATFFLQVWYTLQVSLNSDVLKPLFAHGVRQKDRRKSLSGIKCTKIVRPIKVHTITEDDVDRVLCEGLEEHHMLQYLIGGWRYITDLDSGECDVLMIPSGWYQFDELVSGPIDWLSVQEEFGQELYTRIKDNPDFEMNEESVTELLLSLIEKREDDKHGTCK